MRSIVLSGMPAIMPDSKTAGRLVFRHAVMMAFTVKDGLSTA